MEFSIVIPTYNRLQTILDAVDSGLAWLAALGDGEIVIVDDASTDGTLLRLQDHYANALKVGQIRLIALPNNLGVTGARNAGAAAARGTWLVLLDSDDVLIEGSAPSVMQRLAAHQDGAIVMFRCVERASGRLIGASQTQEVQVDRKSFLRGWHYSECLPVIRRDALLACPYDADLRGFEILAYLRLMARFGPMLVSPIVARRYTTQGGDRLSAPKVFAARARQLARGHARTLRENWHCFPAGGLIRQCAKIGYYSLRSLLVRSAI